MWDRLSLVTPPASPPVSLEEAKGHLRVEHNAEDSIIIGLIKAAVAAIDGPNGIGVVMASQVWRLALDSFPSVIVLPMGPVISVDQITYVDGDGITQTLDPSEYQADTKSSPARVAPAYGKGWPGARCVLGAVQVTFTAGHTSVPEDLKAAVLLLVGHLYEHRDAVVLGGMAELPMGVAAILDRYRVGRAA